MTNRAAADRIVEELNIERRVRRGAPRWPRAEVADGENPEATGTAEQIIAAQEADFEQMKDMLDS